MIHATFHPIYATSTTFSSTVVSERSGGGNRQSKSLFTIIKPFWKHHPYGILNPGLEPFLAVAHMTLAAPRRWSWPALHSHQTQDVCVNMERLHAEASWALFIRADVLVPLCRRLPLLKLHFSFNVDTLMSPHSDSRRFCSGNVASCRPVR